MKKKDIKTISEAVHLLGIITFLIGPLVVYFIREEKLIREHTKKALNWQFSFLIYFTVLSSIYYGTHFFIVPLFGVYSSNFLVNILVIINIVFCIIAFSKASNNKLWDYPLAIKFFND